MKVGLIIQGYYVNTILKKNIPCFIICHLCPLHEMIVEKSNKNDHHDLLNQVISKHILLRLQLN